MMSYAGSKRSKERGEGGGQSKGLGASSGGGGIVDGSDLDRVALGHIM